MSDAAGQQAAGRAAPRALRRPAARPWLAAALAAALVGGVGCGPRYQRVSVVDTDRLTVVLRAEVESGGPVDQHYDQPVTISAVRLSHILARVDIRMYAGADDRGERKPAIATDLIFPVSDALHKAFAQADSSQHVVVQAIRIQRRLGIFKDEYLTSFIAFVDSQDRLQLHFSRVDWLIPKDRKKDVAEPRLGESVMKFRTIAGDQIDVVAEQGVAVNWRAPEFRSASALMVGPGGKVRRRTILMESPPESDSTPGAEGAEPEAPAATLPMDPDALRKLADLEEARREGTISEAEYNQQRREILESAAGAAGSGSP